MKIEVEATRGVGIGTRVYMEEDFKLLYNLKVAVYYILI
jgi:hypothetical protein